MDEILTVNKGPSTSGRLLSALAPMLLVAVAYVDPGKWAAAAEGGARFGCDIVILMLVFNFAAVLYQYLSARIAVVTGKDLAQICSEEYDKVTCIFLGVQAELSVIVLDLTMILGAAHGFHLIFGADLLTCVFLTAVDALLFPFFSTLLEERKARFLCTFAGSFILVSYFIGVLSSQSGIPFSVGGMLTKFSGEGAAALMSLLGASIMPQNFYLHSSIIKQECGGTSVSKESRCHDHLFAILSIFSGIFLVNYMLVNSAANAFYTSDLLLLTFQDVLSLMDQVFRNSAFPFVLLLVLVFSNHITALTWNLGRQAILHNLFKADIPGWFHHATIRVIAIVPALYCVFSSGAEGAYQLLMFSEIVIALLLPTSVIPLFRVATSKSVMGEYKISQSVEFLVLVSFIGMLGLEIVFVIEMIFGSSEWATNLRWNMGSGMSVPFVVLLVIASVSLCVTLWLVATPLTSSSRLDVHEYNWELQASVPESYSERDRSDDFSETQFQGDESSQKLEATLASDGSHLDMLTSNPAPSLPEELLDSDSRPYLTTIDENCSDIKYTRPSMSLSRNSTTTVEMVAHSNDSIKLSDTEAVDATTLTNVPSEVVVTTSSGVADSKTEKDDERDTWDLEESSKSVSLSSPSATSEGPGSYRSLSGKGDDVGSGTGSLSRLAGLGRGARRQLAIVLDEFWGQLFDFHGQATQEAKSRKLDALLGLESKIDSKPALVSPKLDNSRKEFTGTIQSVSGRNSDSAINSNLYDSPRKQSGPSAIESYYGIQRDLSSLWSSSTQLLDTYMQSSNRNAMDPGERRYSSLRLPPSADVYEEQPPATIHGYQIAYLSRLAKERSSGSLAGQMESLAPKSPSLVSSNYRDPFATTSVQKPRNGLSAKTPPGFPSLAVSRNNSLQSDRPFYGMSSNGPPAENVGSSVNTKKYHSLPDISGLSLPHRNSLLSDSGGPWDSTTVYRPSTSRAMHETSLYPNALSKAYLSSSSVTGAPLVYDEFSSSKVCRDAFSLKYNSSLHAGSLWSRQPCEQFGVAGKARATEGEGAGGIQNSVKQDMASTIDFEAKLLQSFRICIQKLLKLEGSDWLFRQNDGADEELIDRVAERERFFYEAETREMNLIGHIGESHFPVDRKTGFAQKNEEMVTSVPHCGEGCIWRVDLIISFGVWCIHRVLELSLMESRPELWGKYTYVLNRLQGIIDLAFSRPRSPMSPCFCLQIPVTHQRQSSPPISHGSLPPPAKQARGKCTTAPMLLDIVKDVEIAISCRKGRTGTAAGDVAFPKGKENLASVLKRYKRRLANKPVGTPEGGSGLRKVS